MASSLIRIDPVTRIEGHLRVTVEIDKPAGKNTYEVKDAWVTSTMFRGFNILCRGRDPRDVWHMGARVCGVCPSPHGINGVQATERAFGLERVPDNARLVRNMVEATQLAYDHVLWFYHLNGLDYVNVVDAATEAKPTRTDLRELQGTLKAFIATGRLGPFANHWWDHPGYKLPAELDLELVKHYLDALGTQRRVNEAAAIIGGKFPMVMNLVPGGVTHLPSVPQILDYRERLAAAKEFIDGVMLPDLLAIAPFYATELASQGRGHANYLTWGVLDRASQDPYERVFPRGAIRAGKLTAVKVDPKECRIHTKRAWFSDGAGAGRHPLDFAQEEIEAPDKMPDTRDDLDGKYGWTAAARLADAPMEVGPLAATLVAYASGRGEVVALVKKVLAAVGSHGRPAPVEALMSNLGRLAGRVIHAKVNADHAVQWADQLIANLEAGDKRFFVEASAPKSADAEGTGGWDAPRGALCHYIRVRQGNVESYAPVPASNWNLAPRDDAGVRGPVEEALVGTPVADPKRPLEVLRTVHSFDP